MFLFLGPAPESVTNAIYEITKNISSYRIVPDLKCSIDYCGFQYFQVFDTYNMFTFSHIWLI